MSIDDTRTHEPENNEKIFYNITDTILTINRIQFITTLLKINYLLLYFNILRKNN